MTNETRDPSFLKSVKGKVIFGFLVGVAALAASYFISKGAFDEVEETLSQISTPNEKLRLINVVFQDILLLNRFQNDLPGTLTNGRSQQEIRRGYAEHAGRLKGRLDTLASWFAGSPGQLARLDSIQHILDKRTAAFEAYMRERRGFVGNTDLKKNVESISEIIETSKDSKGDSTVITTEKRTTTTTITKDPPATVAQAGDQDQDDSNRKGFFNKLFKSSKKPKEEEHLASGDPVVIRQEEIKVLIDTLTIARNDSAIQIVGEAIRSMAESQMVRANRYLERERQLQLGEALLISKLMEVMREVEEDVLNTMYRENEQVKETIGSSIKNIGFILLGVFSLTALLGFWIFADITRSNEYRKELILAKEEADYHSEAKQRFLANMSHEIRTPLQSIVGFSELAKSQENPSRAQLDIIHKSSEHLLHLVNEILDYSRIISDSFEFVEESFEVEQLLTEVVETLRPQASGKGLTLTLKNGFENPTFVLGDAFRLKQILHNLLGNAIKFTKEGEVELTAAPVATNGKKEIRLEVRDTGIGMTREQIRRIFNQFEQGHAGITPEYGGSGLGLSIARTLVAGQGGRITVDSKLGSYSLFTIYLPFREGEPVAKTEVYEYERDTDLGFTGKAWVIDDDPYILQWISAVLEQHRVPVRAFSSPLEADAAPWDPEVSIVFVDMRMPQMSGVALFKRLKVKVPGPVKFVACTAMALPEEREFILEEGFDEVLMKPFKKADILNVVSRGAEDVFCESTGEDKDHRHISDLADRPDLTGKYELMNGAAELHREIDISNLVSMTMGDEQLLKDSLGQFVEDTVHDLAQVEEALDTAEDHTRLRELFHRLAGRTSQVGAIGLGARMRQVELALAENEAIQAGEISEVVRSGYLLVEEIQEKYVS